jgi:hypothetical protein
MLFGQVVGFGAIDFQKLLHGFRGGNVFPAAAISPIMRAGSPSHDSFLSVGALHDR